MGRTPEIRGSATRPHSALRESGERSILKLVRNLINDEEDNPMIDISAAAVGKIKEMLEGEGNPKLFLRLGVNEGGCSGFTYQMGLDDERSEGDREMDFDGLPVVVAEADMKYLNGLKVDYQDSGMTGGFTIDNPNAVATCGCGSSFRTREEAGKAEVCE